MAIRRRYVDAGDGAQSLLRVSRQRVRSRGAPLPSAGSRWPRFPVFGSIMMALRPLRALSKLLHRRRQPPSVSRLRGHASGARQPLLAPWRRRQTDARSHWEAPLHGWPGIGLGVSLASCSSAIFGPDLHALMNPMGTCVSGCSTWGATLRRRPDLAARRRCGRGG